MMPGVFQQGRRSAQRLLLVASMHAAVLSCAGAGPAWTRHSLPAVVRFKRILVARQLTCLRVRIFCGCSVVVAQAVCTYQNR